MSTAGSRAAQLRRYVHACAVSALAALAATCGSTTSPSQPIPPDPPGPIQTTAVLVGAGDIADCANDGGRHAEDTAKLLDGMADSTVFAAGDLAYMRGTTAEFANCYDPRWGRHKRRTRPAPGNHEYETRDAFPYFNYFGDAAAPPTGYYSYDLAAWHIIVLNSVIPATQGSEQWIWLREDLQSSRARCQLAYWHHPRFTSGPSLGMPAVPVMGDVWQVLYDFKAEVVINGHDHFYERFAAQDPTGRRVPDGIRQFTVGTGGAPLYPVVNRRPTSDFQLAAYGVLRMTLQPDKYEWSFIEAITGATRDPGFSMCH